MKLWKKIACLAFASTLLVGCNVIASSSWDSSDQGSSSGEVTQGTVAAMANEIAYAASKYAVVTPGSILSGAKAADPSLDENKAATYADLFLLSYLAFKDSLGEKVGARVYEWYVNAADAPFSNFDSSSIYTTAFRLFSDAGIVDASQYGTSFDASQVIADSDLRAFLQHIHYYIGGSAQDDFFGYVNKDQRLEPVEDKGPNDPLYKDNLTNMDAYKAWVNDTLANVPSAKYLDESFRAVGESNLFKEILLRYDSVTSVAELYSLLIKDLQERGYSPIYESMSTDMTNENGALIAFPQITVRNVNGSSEAYVEGRAIRESTVSTYAAYFSALLGDSSKGEALAEQYADYLYLLLLEKEKHPEYSDEANFVSDPTMKIGSLNVTIGDFASALGLKDVMNLNFASFRAAMAFFNLFKDENLSALKGLCAVLIMEHYKILLPDTDLFNRAFVSASIVGSKYSNDGFLRNSLYPLYAGNLMNYYATTEDYATNLSVLEDLSVSLKETMREKFSSSTWLSDEGKTKVIRKLDNMKSVVLAKQDNGETLSYLAPDYGALGTEETALNYIYDYDLALFERCASLFSASGDAVKYGIAAVAFNPLTINAFYSPSGNFFVLLPGFMFSIGKPADLTEEQVMGTYGWIIAHEMGHGYDTDGFLFDYEGNNDPNYMPSADKTAFYALAERYKAQLAEQEILAGIKSDPDFILVEAVADNIGLSVALASGLKKENFSAEKFFIALARSFGGQISRYTALEYSKADSHPVVRARINPPLRNFNEFHEIYKTKEGDFMYLAPEERVLIY